MSRRRRRRRHTPVPEPQSQVARKYCEALADEDDRYSDPLCPKLIPVDGPRLCLQHTRECAESYNIYKDASLRAEELQPCVSSFSRKIKRGGFHRLWELDEAIDITGEFLYWAREELEGRRVHAARFYAYVGSDPGHDKRIANVEKLIGKASSVRFDLTMRKIDLQVELDALRRERERDRLLRGWRPPRIRSPSPEEEVRVVRCFAMRVLRPDEYEPEDPEELDDSALGATMDEEELLADERAEREVSEMLRWYSQSGGVAVPMQAAGHARAREDSVDTLTFSMGNLDVLAPD